MTIKEHKKINEFVRTIKKYVRLKHVYVFGSFINGKHKEYSDIDVAIVSDDFTGFGFDDRKKINPAILEVDINIEPHPFTTKEFRKRNPFVSTILKTGRKIL